MSGVLFEEGESLDKLGIFSLFSTCPPSTLVAALPLDATLTVAHSSKSTIGVLELPLG